MKPDALSWFGLLMVAVCVVASVIEGPRWMIAFTAVIFGFCVGFWLAARRWQPRTSDRTSIEELLDRSSLGTPGAKALRRRTPPEVVEEIMRKVDERSTDNARTAGQEANDA